MSFLRFSLHLFSFSGPGTIFLMLVGAFVAAFKISNWISFYYNLIPIIVYMGVCLMAPSKWQLILSAILSTFYALVMMAVIVGTSLQLGEVRFLCFHKLFSICTILIILAISLYILTFLFFHC